MIIGIDFDNTIVDCDKLFYQSAVEKGLISGGEMSKEEIRDALRRAGKEDDWTRLQGFVYGSALLDAPPFEGVREFFRRCSESGIEVYIVSHKTRHPYLGEEYDLHQTAMNWLEKNGFFSDLRLPRSHVRLEVTKQDKMAKIGELKCAYFFDDLPEFLSDAGFPSFVNRVLFDPHSTGLDSGLTRIENWSDADEILNIGFLRENNKALSNAGLIPFDGLSQVPGGRNNRIYRLRTSGQSWILKKYFRHPEDARERGRTEFNFLKFIYSRGVRMVPEPVYFDEAADLGVYQDIPGEKPRKVTGKLIDQAVRLFHEINRFRKNDEAARLPEASEACFSFREHAERIGARIDRLSSVRAVGADADKIKCLAGEAKIIWEAARNSFLQQIDAEKFNFDEMLSGDDRCLSPSDFGFHNAIMKEDGSATFIDFEYAGWDDPAKMVCDFVCQPQVPVGMDRFEAIGHGFLSSLERSEWHFKRAVILLPLYRLKWVAILMNDFLNVGKARRDFSKSGDAMPDQIRKVQSALEAIHG